MRIDTMINIAGGLIWIAPRSFGGHSPKVLSDIWMGGGPETVGDLINKGAMMPLTLYQDDGYSVRIVEGVLTEQEKEEWVAHACMNLNIPCGELLVSGVLTPDFETLEYPKINEIQDGTSSDFGCYVKIKPGKYRVDLYSYPPGDLSSAWGHIVDSKTFGKHPSLKAEEQLKYFKRTRPDEEAPDWVKEEDDETFYVNFLIQLSPEDKTLTAINTQDDEPCLSWNFRKPERCPVGIPLSFEPE